MRIRIKDETINLVNVRIEKKSQEYSEKIAKVEQEHIKLQEDLKEELAK